MGADSALVTLGVLRLDGTVVETWPAALDIANSTVTIGDVFWTRDTEDVLGYRITTTGPGDVVVDWILVGLTT